MPSLADRKLFVLAAAFVIGMGSAKSNGPVYAQEAHLKPAAEGVVYGDRVALSGDTLVVNGSAVGDPSVGAAFVYVRESGIWRQQGYLRASNSEPSDGFGRSVAIDGDTIVIGAEWEDAGSTGVNGDGSDNSALFAGAAYVFVRDGDGVWSEQAYLKASNTGERDNFGGSVAISGNTIVVSARAEDSPFHGVGGSQEDSIGSEDSGAAYVFVRNGTTWSQQAYLKASNAQWGYRFGRSVGVSGDTIAVGTVSESSNATGVDGDGSNNEAPAAGAAYVFVREGVTWRQQAYLKAGNAEPCDWFGDSVAVSGDTVVVGAGHESGGGMGIDSVPEDNSEQYSGAAYVFEREGATWRQRVYLKAHNAGSNDLFGGSVQVSGNKIVVGASRQNGGARGVNGIDIGAIPDSGAAYLFERDGSGWSQAAYLKADDPREGEWFGATVALSGDSVAIGVRFGDGAGAVTFNLFEDPLLPLTLSRSPSNTTLSMPLVRTACPIGVEYSPDLSPHSWIDLGNLFEFNGRMQFTDPDTLRRERRSGFYRAFLRPRTP